MLSLSQLNALKGVFEATEKAIFFVDLGRLLSRGEGGDCHWTRVFTKVLASVLGLLRSWINLNFVGYLDDLLLGGALNVRQYKP